MSPAAGSELDKKAYIHIADWRLPYRAGITSIWMWMGSTCAATEMENLKTWLFW